MRRFRFRLAKVLKLRAHGERAARRRLAETLSVLTVLTEEMRSLELNLAACREDGVAGSASALAHALEAGLVRRRHHVARRMELAVQHVHAARRAYQDARVDHRAMSNLRSRLLESWRRAVEAQEQAELDEMARTRFLIGKASR